MPFPLRDIRENPRSNVRACATADGAICSKNRKIVPYHGANPNTKNGALTVSVPDYGSCLDLFFLKLIMQSSLQLSYGLIKICTAIISFV